MLSVIMQSAIKLNVTMLSVIYEECYKTIMLSVAMLSVVMLNVIMLRTTAP
jgi:hypothetical protein